MVFLKQDVLAQIKFKLALHRSLSTESKKRQQFSSNSPKIILKIVLTHKLTPQKTNQNRRQCSAYNENMKIDTIMVLGKK